MTSILPPVTAVNTAAATAAAAHLFRSAAVAQAAVAAAANAANGGYHPPHHVALGHPAPPPPHSGIILDDNPDFKVQFASLIESLIVLCCPRKRLVRRMSSCPCLTLLPGPAWFLLSKIYNLLRALFTEM